ncbi:hypothetical protein HY484_00155 [Candidatus Woesearchaeota archaeon]|nr:hypothetical protein [Candidatus Woesearchaeota archaeon]
MLPFIMFKSKQDHQKALALWANIARENDDVPLEHRIRGTIIKFDGKGSELHQGVYVLSPVFIKIFDDNNVEYDMLDTPAKIGEHLSVDGKEELQYILKYRRNEITQQN